MNERPCEERSNLCFDMQVLICYTDCFVPRSDVLLHYSITDLHFHHTRCNHV